MNKNYLFKLKFNNQNKIIFSLPQSSHYQQISNLKINSLNYQIIDEKKWGNKIVILNLVQDLKQHNFISLKIKPLPFKSSINPNFSLSSYQKTKIPKIYLTPNRFINGNDPKIKSLAKKVIGDEKNLLKIVRKLYDFTLDYLTYGKPIDDLYPYHKALNKKITDCGGFSTFLASLFQSQNIPTRLLVGFIIKKNIIKDLLTKLTHCHSERIRQLAEKRRISQLICDLAFVKDPSLTLRMTIKRLSSILSKLPFVNFSFHDLLIHAWLEILLPNNQWFPLDPSLDWRRKKGQTKRQGGFGFIPDDRLVTSFGCDFDLKVEGGNYKIDLLQKPLLVTCNLYFFLGFELQVISYKIL